MTLFEELLEGWRYSRDGVIAELENLPVARFAECPAGLQRTPLELANHIVEAGWLMAGELSRADGDFQRKPYPELIAEHWVDAPATTRADAIAQLGSSLERGITMLQAAGETQLRREIRQFNGVPASRLSWLCHGIAHEEYHRGQIALYARLFGEVPALTKQIHGTASTSA